jgi:hypothetical protein
MQCKARYCREKQELKFPQKSGYFTEKRCGELALGDGPDPDLCAGCQKKAAKPFRIGCQQGQYQGKVDEPYFDGSWIFGSDRFTRFNSMPGNALSDEEFSRAEAAQKIARQGSEMKSKADPKIVPVATVPKTKAPETATAGPLQSKKAQNKVVVPKVSSAKVLPIGVELMGEPIEAVEVLKIQVKPYQVEGKSYWIDKDQNVYEKGKLAQNIPFDPSDNA